MSEGDIANPPQPRIPLSLYPLTPMPPTPNYTGAGFAFPIHVNVQGSFQLSTDAPNLEESIRIILGTKLGERVYRPNFGSRLSELVFEPLNSRTLMLVRLYVEEALELWEPRITLQDILTIPNPNTGQVDIEIQYRPKNSYDSRSMVFPFYLLPPEEVGVGRGRGNAGTGGRGELRS